MPARLVRKWRAVRRDPGQCQDVVLEHAAIHAAGDRHQLARLAGGRHAPGRRGRRRPRVVAVQHDGRRLSIRVRVALGPSPSP